MNLTREEKRLLTLLIDDEIKRLVDGDYDLDQRDARAQAAQLRHIQRKLI